MILVSHIFNTLDLSSTIIVDSLSTVGTNLSTNNSVNKHPTTNMLPQYITSLNSSGYNHFVCYFLAIVFKFLDNLRTNDDPILRHNTSLPTNIMSVTSNIC